MRIAVSFTTCPIHVPFMAKQPPVKLMPLLAVEDAVVDVRLKTVAWTPPAMVEVPVPCTTRLPVVVAPPLTVRPVACVPAPTVEDAVATNPLESVARPAAESVDESVVAPVTESVEVAVTAPPRNDVPDT